MKLKRIMKVQVSSKKDPSKRPRAHIITSSSRRFKKLIDLYVKDRFEQGTSSDMVRVPGGARVLLKGKILQETFLNWIEESVLDGAVKVLLMMNATEGESLDESGEILERLRALVKRRTPRVVVDVFVMRNDGLYGEDHDSR